MYIQRTYWKWKRKLDEKSMNLGETILKNEIGRSLKEQSFEKTNAYRIFESTEYPKILVSLNEENRIIEKTFLKGSKIGEFNLRTEFKKIICSELREFLEECDKETKGEILEVVFGDALLGIAILKEKN